MMSSSAPAPPPPWLRDPLTRRGIMVAAVTLALLIPLAMVHGVVRERGALQADVREELGTSLGGAQTLIGPILVVPYTYSSTIEDRVGDAYGNVQTRQRVTTQEAELFLLPQKLTLRLGLEGERRRRGIYRALATTTAVEASGYFELGAHAELIADEGVAVHWSRAWLAVGLTHPRAILQVSSLEMADAPLAVAPGTRVPRLLEQGFHAPVDATAVTTARAPFSLTLAFTGLGPVAFAPLGASTTGEVTSAWPHPSFTGELLPRQYGTGEGGFEALWEIPQLVRSYPQAFTSLEPQAPHLAAVTAGVGLFEPVSVYSRVSRSVKYGVLFIITTFVVLLALELLLVRSLHVAQYVLVGVSLTLFFLVLLSLAETIGFALAYLFATGTTVAMTSSYAGAALHSRRFAIALAGLLTLAYGLLYVLLQLEDLALLMGTAVLLLALALLMRLTRGLSE